MIRIKVIPAYSYDIAGLEAWLERCADEGLTPVWMGGVLCILKSGKPERRRYRLEPMRKEREPSEELLELYGEAGWQYVCRADGFFLFSSADSAASEPYTDGESRSEALRNLARSVKSLAWRQAAVGLILLGLLAVGTVMRPASALWMLVRIPVTGFLWILWFQITSLQNWRRLREIRASLAEEREPSPCGDGRRSNRISAVLSGLCAAALVVNFSVSRLEYPWEKGIAPPLTSIEDDGYAVQDEERSGQYEACTLWAPVQIQTRQEIWLEGESAPKDSRAPGQYSPSLNMAYYRLTLPFMTRGLAWSQMDHFRIENLDWETRELSYPGTDFVLLAVAEDGFQMAAIGCGGRLAVYRYNGEQRLTDHLELLSAPVRPQR